MALAGAQRQMVHADQPWSWETPEKAAAAGEQFPHRATRVFVNIYVPESTAENGATEVWPGTHRLPESAALPVGWYHEAEAGTQVWSG